jgi:hypothetical protein
MSNATTEFNSVAEDFPRMCLVGIARVDQAISNNEMPKLIRVKVTSGTKRVAILLRGISLSFGKLSDWQSRPVGTIRWQTEIMKLENNLLEFNILAQLLCDHPTDKWFGNISLDVFCFA